MKVVSALAHRAGLSGTEAGFGLDNEGHATGAASITMPRCAFAAYGFLVGERLVHGDSVKKTPASAKSLPLTRDYTAALYRATQEAEPAACPILGRSII
ncbi:MAG: hypothetical protein IPK39_22885 [Sulfuritalea sp.]|nr:hypothetical protein [Sulfuritalea sp.]